MSSWQPFFHAAESIGLMSIEGANVHTKSWETYLKTYATTWACTCPHTHTKTHVAGGHVLANVYDTFWYMHIKCSNITCLFWFYPPFSGLLTIFDPSPHRSLTHGLHRARNPAGKDWRIHWAAGAGRRKTDPAKESSMIKGYKGHTPNLNHQSIDLSFVWWGFVNIDFSTGHQDSSSYASN